jgi:geranylgeranyl diphosphate synthase type I
MMSAVEMLLSYNQKLEPVMHRYMDRKMEEALKLSPDCGQMVSNIKEFTLRGGKRVRPALIYHAFRCFEQGREEDIILASACLEFLHSYLLIHDDIMDADDVRRGSPTMHRIYESSPAAAGYRSSQSYGSAMAIIAGDIASAMAVDALALPGFPADRQLEAIRKLSEITLNVCHGQTLDVMSAGRTEYREEDAALVNKLKTACYTIEGPLHIGGILAGASDYHLRAFSAYAVPLGQAFQIMDDILGLYGDQQQTGKPVGSDLKEGKKTLLIVKALESANEAQAAVIQGALGNQEITPAGIAAVQTAVEETGTLTYCREAAMAMAEQAKAALPSTLATEGRDFLIAIADYIVSRDN